MGGSDRDGERARGSALAAVGIVTLVAVLAAGGLVAWARLTAGAPTSVTDPVAEERPSRLAGGHKPGPVPEAVAAAFDEPVVGTRLLTEVPGDVPGCDFGPMEWQEPPQLEYALVTPEGLFTSFVGSGVHAASGLRGMPGRPPMMPPPDVDTAVAVPAVPKVVVPERPGGADEAPVPPAPDVVPLPEPSGPAESLERLRMTCQITWDERRGWLDASGGIQPVSVPEVLDDTGVGASCCDEQGLGTAQATVVAPPDAAWAVQDRGGWWLAHPVDSRHLVVWVTWKFRQSRFEGHGQTHVVFLDAEGQVIDERFVGL